MTARVETEIDMMDNDATGQLDRELDPFLLTLLAQHTRSAEAIETEYISLAQRHRPHRQNPPIARAESGRLSGR
jgi:hypothetical protein